MKVPWPRHCKPIHCYRQRWRATTHGPFTRRDCTPSAVGCRNPRAATRLNLESGDAAEVGQVPGKQGIVPRQNDCGNLEIHAAEPRVLLANARRLLRAPISWCPDAMWRLAVAGRFRVLYTFDAATVDIVCLAQKETEQMEDATVIFAPKRSAGS